MDDMTGVVHTEDILHEGHIGDITLWGKGGKGEGGWARCHLVILAIVVVVVVVMVVVVVVVVVVIVVK